MKSFFKKSAISIVILGMASSVCAATHFSGAFIGVEGLNLRPMNGDLDYVTVYPSFNNGSYYTNTISPSYDWNWRIFGGVKFTENDDITLSWFSMNTSENSSVSPRGAINGFGFSGPVWINGNNVWNNVLGHVTFDVDDVYAVWGHTIHFNNPWSVRFAAGLEYAKIDSDLRVTSNSIFSDETNIGFEAKNDTKGIGPRVEMDMTYHLPYGFALFGNANTALLVSRRDISLDPTTHISVDRFGTTFINYPSDFSNRHVVIPKFGMRLGASYTYVWGQAGAEGASCKVTTLTVDAGWQAESYIHAIESPVNGFFDIIPSQPDLTAPPQVSGFASTKASNFSNQGLFVGINLGTDWM
jgi:hypothetical protein